MTEEQVEQCGRALGELPAALRQRLEQTYGITPYDSDVLVNQGRRWSTTTSSWPSAAATARRPATGCSRTCCGRSTSAISDRGVPAPAAVLAELLKKVKAGDVDTSRGREVLPEDARHRQAARRRDGRAGHRGGRRVGAGRSVPRAVAANPKIVADVKGGKLQAAGAHRPGQEEEPQRQPGPRSRDLPGVDREDVTRVLFAICQCMAGMNGNANLR